jgi:hypothetical protein
VRLVIVANSETDRLSTLERLRTTIEELKVSVRIWKEANAFKNFKTFVFLIEQAISLSRQCEGWIRYALQPLYRFRKVFPSLSCQIGYFRWVFQGHVLFI